MSNAARTLAALVVAAAIAVPAAAQDAPQPVSRADISARLDQRFRLIDGNKDGSFTRAEFAAAQKAAQGDVARDLMKALTAEFTALDTSGDKSLSSAELGASHKGKSDAESAELFKTIDANRDGKISLMEYTVPATRVVATVNPDTQMKKFDGNGDGKVTLAEFKAPALASFDAADSDKDGIVSVDEQKKARAARGR